MAYAKKSSEGMTKWEVFVRNAKDFGNFLYDKEKGEVMGRNAASWGKITLFFVIFYLCLSGFFAAMLTAFLATLPDRSDGPKLTQYLAGKPVLNPFPSNKISAGSYDVHVKKINKLLEPYKAQLNKYAKKYDSSFCNMSVAEERPASQKKQCRFDLNSLGPCYKDQSEFKYGYDEGSPCFFLKMNRVFNWVPEPTNGRSYVEVKCKPSKSVGVEIYPKTTPGWAMSFYPYRIEDYWLAPLVAVKVNTTSKVYVKCDAVAKNIQYSTTYLLERGAYGRIRIEVNS